MANKKVSELTEATSVNSADVMPVAQSGASKKVTMSNLISSLLQLVSGSVKGLTSVNDSNSNEVLKFASSANAVNEITITNNATGVAPTITATGNDTNIDLVISSKGSGKVKIGTGSIQYPNTDGTSGQTLKTNAAGVLAFSKVSSSGYATGSLTTSGSGATNATITVTHNLGYIPTNITFSGTYMLNTGVSKDIFIHNANYCAGVGQNSYYKYIVGSSDTSDNVLTTGAFSFSTGTPTVTGVVQNLNTTTFDIYLSAPIGNYGTFTFKTIYNCS